MACESTTIMITPTLSRNAVVLKINWFYRVACYVGTLGVSEFLSNDGDCLV